jgi:CheY-like chemotaxis protein
LEVNVEATRVHPALADLPPDLEEGDYVVLCVRDTGCGIPPELLSRIFDPFFTTKPPGEGTGMGLSVVHGIVEAHGGAISVTSEPGRGTTFTVYLPAVAAPAPPSEPAAESEGLTQGQGQRIVYVDNEELLTGMVKRMLEILGYRATVFDDAAKALDHVRAHPNELDLLISDLEMPGLSGAALARRLWEVRPGLPVLFVSGASKSLTRKAALHLGACDVLLKPFDLHSLGEAVASVLGEEAVKNPS